MFHAEHVGVQGPHVDGFDIDRPEPLQQLPRHDLLDHLGKRLIGIRAGEFGNGRDDLVPPRYFPRKGTNPLRNGGDGAIDPH